MGEVKRGGARDGTGRGGGRGNAPAAAPDRPRRPRARPRARAPLARGSSPSDPPPWLTPPGTPSASRMSAREVGEGGGVAAGGHRQKGGRARPPSPARELDAVGGGGARAAAGRVA